MMHSVYAYVCVPTLAPLCHCARILMCSQSHLGVTGSALKTAKILSPLRGQTQHVAQVQITSGSESTHKEKRDRRKDRNRLRHPHTHAQSYLSDTT